MSASVTEKLHNRFFDIDIALKAKEDWSKGIQKNPDTFKKLIRAYSQFELALKKHFKDLANNRVEMFINWAAYSMENIKADDRSDFVNSIVVNLDNYSFVDERQLLLVILQQYMLAGISLGVDAAQQEYVDAGLSATSVEVQKMAMDYSSQLVTSITETTRKQIQQSVANSLQLHQTIEQATSDLTNIVGDSYRAEMIASTEMRNSYVDGQGIVADQTNATAKQWDPSSDPCELCQDNVDDGTIAIDDDFTNGDDPHPWCRCGILWLYGDQNV